MRSIHNYPTRLEVPPLGAMETKIPPEGGTPNDQPVLTNSLFVSFVMAYFGVEKMEAQLTRELTKIFDQHDVLVLIAARQSDLFAVAGGRVVINPE